MDQAVKYTELMTKFIESIPSTTSIVTGRRFDRVFIANKIGFFVDRNSWEIYGAKSHFQYNPRRWYGTLETASQYDWQSATPTPKPGTDAEKVFTERESEIVKNYKPRGRPRKNP